MSDEAKPTSELEAYRQQFRIEGAEAMKAAYCKAVMERLDSLNLDDETESFIFDTISVLMATFADIHPHAVMENMR